MHQRSSDIGRQSGFTLLETVLAIGILAIIVTNILGSYTNSVVITQTSINNMKATWVMRRVMSQIQYKIDTIGIKEAFRPGEIRQKYGTDPVFDVLIQVKDPLIEGSRLLQSAINMQTAMKGSGDEEGGGGNEEGGSNPADFVKQFGPQIDALLPKDMYRSLKITVSWEQGQSTRSIESGLFLIDDQQLKGGFNIAGLPGGGGGGEGGSGEE